MKINPGYYIENNRVIYTNNTDLKMNQQGRTQSSETGRFKDILQVESQKEPDAPILRVDRFNKLLFNGLHILLDYDFSKLPEIAVKDNVLDVPTDKPFSIGEFNGKPTPMRIFSYGGMENILSMLGSGDSVEETGSAKVTLLDQLSFQIPQQYSSTEQKEIRNKSHTVFFLNKLASGNYSMEQFNEYVRQEHIDLQKELTALGFDLSKEFTVNGTKLMFKNGQISIL